MRIIYIFASPSETSNWLNPVEWIFISPDMYVVLHYLNYKFDLGMPGLPQYIYRVLYFVAYEGFYIRGTMMITLWPIFIAISPLAIGSIGNNCKYRLPPNEYFEKMCDDLQDNITEQLAGTMVDPMPFNFQIANAEILNTFAWWFKAASVLLAQ